jgi:hypothetical protein
MSYNPKQLFSQIQKKEQDNASGSGNNSGFTNPLIFKPKVGSSYAVRLLWLSPDKGCDREYPMINSFIHRVWDDNATTGSKDVKVICPTSQYMMGETSAAFRRCPICEAASAFYKQGQEGSKSGEELYNKFRRTCQGFVPVYIVNGPEEDIHQIRILQYGKQFKDFFDSKIFGIKKQNKYADADSQSDMDDEAIGLEAFMYYDESVDQIVTRGYDLLITATTKKMNLGGKQIDMPQYQLDFTRKLRDIRDLDGVELDSDAGIKYFNSLNSEVLHFDKDFYIKSTDADLQDFKLNYITGSSVADADDEDAIMEQRRPPVALPKKKQEVVEDETSEDDDEIPMGKTAARNTRARAVIEDEIPMETPKSKPARKPVVVDDEDDGIPRTTSGEIDIDALIGEFDDEN